MKIKITEDIAKFVSPKSPKNVRLMAAKGVIPLPPKDLIKILFILCFDRDAEIKKKAQNTFRDFSTDIVMDIIDGDLEPAVIDFLIRYHKDRKKFVKNVILNKNTSDDTIAYLAGANSPSIVEIISQNQERLSRSQKIFDALMGNPALSMSLRERLREFKDGFGAVSAKTEALSDAGGNGGDTDVEVSTESGDTGITAAETGGDEKEASAEDEDEHKNIAQKILNMTVSEKIKLATIGGKEARTILLKDSSKTVVAATIKSPKITEEEILNVAKSKQASDEAIRLIVLNKEWVKTYTIKLALVNNPKTPPGVAMRFMNTLNKKDIRDLAGSRSVPSLISNTAKKLLQAKDKRN